jgi:hypothetical protein
LISTGVGTRVCAYYKNIRIAIPTLEKAGTSAIHKQKKAVTAFKTKPIDAPIKF